MRKASNQTLHVNGLYNCECDTTAARLECIIVLRYHIIRVNVLLNTSHQL